MREHTIPTTALVAVLCLAAASCNADLVDQLGSANPTLFRMASPGRAEILLLAPSERYKTAYKSFVSETGNLARGAEEKSELRARNAATRIVKYLVLMLGAVNDPALEGRIIDALREFIRMGESLVLGRREPGKAVRVRRLRDRWGEALHPANVARYALRPKPSSPPKSKPLSPGKGGKGKASSPKSTSSTPARQ